MLLYFIPEQEQVEVLTKKQVGQQEMSEVVRLNRHLMTVFGRFVLCRGYGNRRNNHRY